MMLDFPMYEESNGRKEIGKCTICGCSIFSDMDRYYINGEYICEECIDQCVEQFYEEGIEADDLY